nr:MULTISPECIES: hypothetical protein [Rhizobium]
MFRLDMPKPDQRIHYLRRQRGAADDRLRMGAALHPGNRDQRIVVNGLRRGEKWCGDLDRLRADEEGNGLRDLPALRKRGNRLAPCLERRGSEQRREEFGKLAKLGPRGRLQSFEAADGRHENHVLLPAGGGGL